MQNLKRFLAKLENDYHQERYLSSDPLEFVHQYNDPLDQEAVALLSAVLAYGNVKSIRRSVTLALERISTEARSPSAFVRALGDRKSVKKAEGAFTGFVHRFNQGTDLVTLFRLLSSSWQKYGSLGGHFLSHLKPDDADFGRALSRLMQDWNGQALEWAPRPGFSYLLTSPSDGSCCKRWCMLLRWMGRRDQLDPGLWMSSGPLAETFPGGKGLSSRQLVMPLDTHTGRISQYLGLTSRKTLDWKAALEVTAAFKQIDPADPVRYDFALSRLGILDLCQRKYRAEICERCQLLTVCKFAQARAHAQKKGIHV